VLATDGGEVRGGREGGREGGGRKQQVNVTGKRIKEDPFCLLLMLIFFLSLLGL